MFYCIVLYFETSILTYNVFLFGTKAWPWQLWAFVVFVVPLFIYLFLAHIIRAYRKHVLLMKLAELSACLFFFVSPVIPSAYFHMHHWFVGWLLGMHANFDVWWSRAVMAWAWGTYINGVAVYGRDPVLTCEYAYFLTVDQHCPYINCYLEAIANQHNATKNATHHVQEMITPDWRNCSSGYHP